VAERIALAEDGVGHGPSVRAPRAGGVVPRLLVLGGAVLWGTTGTTQALGASGAVPTTVGVMRLLVGALALLAIAALTGRLTSLRRLLAPGSRLAFVVAALSIAAYQVAFFEGVARTGVAVGTIVGIGSAPVFTGLIELIVLRVRPERVWGVATGLAVVGCALLVLAAGDEAVVDPLGITLALGAGASYASFTIASKRLLDSGSGPAEVMAGTFTGGALLLTPLLLGADLGWVATPRGGAAVLWLGVVTVGLGYLLYARGLRRLPAASVATLTLGEPVTAGLLGWVVLGERLGGLGLAGVGLVVAGLAVLALRPGRAAG
jgi:DME family drug/metabolite transporter